MMWPDALGNLRTAGILCQLEVVVGLKVGPKLRRRSKVARQTERGVCRNRSFAPDNVIHPCHWHQFRIDPPETDPPLAIDPNAALSSSVTGESFQTIPRTC
jgi:hypothetical protein